MFLLPKFTKIYFVNFRISGFFCVFSLPFSTFFRRDLFLQVSTAVIPSIRDGNPAACCFGLPDTREARATGLGARRWPTEARAPRWMEADHLLKCLFCVCFLCCACVSLWRGVLSYEEPQSKEHWSRGVLHMKNTRNLVFFI